MRIGVVSTYCALPTLIDSQLMSSDILDINEDKVIAAAEKVLSSGLREAGYQYINIDVCSDISVYI